MSAPTSTSPGLGALGVEAVPTRLSERLAADSEAERVFLAARRRFLADERVDMGALASGLGLDRTSVFRRVGNRDALLAEVLWSLAAPTFDSVDARAVADGAERVRATLTAFVAALIGARAFRGFLAREPTRALRLLMTSHSPVHLRFRTVVEALIAEEIEAGRMTTPLPARDLAFLLVRVAESFAYSDLVAGEAPSAERADAAFGLLLAQSALDARRAPA